MESIDWLEKFNATIQSIHDGYVFKDGCNFGYCS